jgi:hypothetical protein
VRPLDRIFGGRVAEGGGESIGSRTEALSGEVLSEEVGEEAGVDGVIGSGLSGDGVRGIARKGGAFGFSLTNPPSMRIFVVDKVSTRVSRENEEEELIRIMGGGMSKKRASLEESMERAGGRSGERAGKGGDLIEEFSGRGKGEMPTPTREERGRIEGDSATVSRSSSRPSPVMVIAIPLGAPL